ncbi:MAG: hypothetical protein HQL68_01970 [Magnetococcales bacterium]|nr:hypothetical protein [Magnetococcales bacterium]
MNLIRNASHYSHQHTYLDEDANGDYCAVRKLTFHPKGITPLLNEVNGLRWYMQQRGIDVNKGILKEDIREKTGMLILRYVPGETIKILDSPNKTIPRFASILEHYNTIFKNCQFTISHGDYSVANHIFNGANVEWLVDWEHFNSDLPLGYDLVSAFTQPFLFWLLHKRWLSRKTIEEGKYFLLQSQKLLDFDQKIIERPGEWLRKVGIEQQKLWGSQLKKMPFINCYPSLIEHLDRVLGVRTP